MLEKVLQSILRRYFGEFITGLEKVELAFWTGKINIQNASFRHEKINELLKLHNIPLSVKFSYLGGLELDVPWNKLSSAPVEIKLNNLYIVFSLEKLTDHPQLQKLEENAKFLLIKNYVAYIQKKSEQLKNESQSEAGFLKRLLIKILHNVNLQVSNIHIRIETNSTQSEQKMGEGEQEQMFYSCAGEDNTPNGFALGFCIESIEADTINEKNQKKYVHIEHQKTPVRKSINLRQISFYWEEENAEHLFDYSNDKKVQHLKAIIGRSPHRLMTIDGTLLMQKNKNNFQYFFSTSFRVLEIKTNYTQLKQIIQVTQAFINARTKKKIVKMKELKLELQLKLEDQFVKAFQNMQALKFEKTDTKTIQLIDSIDKKLLMQWTKEQTIQLLKAEKVKIATENKNKRSWLKFLSNNTETPLTEAELKLIEEEINKFIAIIDSSDQLSAGMYLLIKQLTVLMDHPKHQQKLLFNTENIELQFEKQEQKLKVGLYILDAALTYHDLKQHVEVPIFRKSSQNSTKLFQLQVQNTEQQQTIDFQCEPVCFIHEVQFLGFISEMANLQEREQGKANVMLINAEALSKHTPDSNASLPQSKKVYDVRVKLKTIQVKIQLDKNTQLHAYIQAINIQKSKQQSNTHSANLLNFGVAYLSSSAQQKSYKIIDDISIMVELVGFKQLKSSISKIKIVLNEESLYAIGSCLKNQYKQLKLRKKQYKNQLMEEEYKFMEGETVIINVLKSYKTYHTVLTEDSLVFLETDLGSKEEKIAKKLPLHNLTLTRCDELSFKLQSVIVNEIIHCKNKEDTDRWAYHIEQRIFEISSKNKIFSMMEQQDNSQPHIYIPYDSTIDITLHSFEVVYLKTKKQPVLNLQLNTLNLLLKENNLQFERKIHLQEILIKNLTIPLETRDEYNTILSNTVNFFQDPDSQLQEIHPNISVLIEGKKKTHPQYTGEITIRSKINKLYINYDAEFIYNILYRLVHGDNKQKPYPETIRNTKVLETLKDILQAREDIPVKYAHAQPFQFDRSYFELEEYKKKYTCMVLFHVQLAVDEAEVNLVNGYNHFWMHKALIDSFSMEIDKSTDFIFLKARAKALTISDLTGFPKTNILPFTQKEPYPLVTVQNQRTSPYAAEVSVGLFQPMTFINKQRFKNYFLMNLHDILINYQQQPILRFIDFLTNQIILFIMEPFSLHKFDSPERGPFAYGPINYTEKQIFKILEECVYPCFTHLHINAHSLAINANTFPNLQGLPLHIKKTEVISAPYINNQRVHVRLDVLKQFQDKYQSLIDILSHPDHFDRLVSKFQWATRYLITAEGVTCPIFQNQFNYQMYFQRANNGDKDLLLPFLMIEKDLLMQGRIQHLSIKAEKRIYNLINKLFNFNISYDDKCDQHYIFCHHLQALNPPNKLMYRLLLGELNYLIPEIKKTVVIIPDCEYIFSRELNIKVMEVNGKCLHLFGNEENSTIIKPIDFDNKKGVAYSITMYPSGEKHMTTTVSLIDFTYQHDYIMQLIKYFLVEEECYPKQDIYDDLPLLTCEAELKDSFFRIAENSEFVYALKGNIGVTWTRGKNIHPQNYRRNKELYPLNSEQQRYDIALKGVSFRKYDKAVEMHREKKSYRALSLPIECSIKLSHIMKTNGDIFYTDMNGDYNIQFLCLKLCYKDLLEIQESFSNGPPKEEKKEEKPAPNLGYVPQSKHNASITKLALEMGLSELPVPLVCMTIENSEVKAELLGSTKILTNTLEVTLDYWNMLIGRWEPVLEQSNFELTLRIGKEKYCSISSAKPILLDLSTESLKVLKMISKDIQQKGKMRTLSREGNIRGMHVSPYAITNRTGLSIFIQNRLLEQTSLSQSKLKNNDTIHIYNKALDLQQTTSVVKYQIQGDPTEHQIHFDIVNSEGITITYDRQEYELILWVISSPILKEIVISSPYVICNKTQYPLLLQVGHNEFRVEPDKKVAIPFLLELRLTTEFNLIFPHLTRTKNNYKFTFRDIDQGYEHYINHNDNELFNCLIYLQKQQENIIMISPATSFVNLLPLDVKMQIALTKPRGDKVTIEQTLEVNKQKPLYQFGSKDTVSIRIKFKGFNYSMFHSFHMGWQRQNMEQTDNKVTFIDHRGLEGSINSKIITKNKKKIIYLYTECVFINQSSYPILLFNQMHLLAGQRLKNIPESESKFVFINEEKEAFVGLAEEDTSHNAKFSLNELGNQNIKVPYSNHLYEMVLHSSVHCVQQEQQLFTKVFKITPRFIVQNKCSRVLCLRQINTEQNFFMKVGELSDWFWHNKDQTKQLALTAMDNEFEVREGWDFSAPIEPENLEQTVLVLRPNCRSPHRLLIKIQIFKELQFTYLVFKELHTIEDSLITFKNNIHLAQLDIHQSFLENLSPPWNLYKHFVCPPMKETPFGWDYPNEDHVICVQFNFLNEYRMRFPSDIVLIDLDKLTKPLIIEFKGDQGEVLEVQVKLQFVGIRKIVIFTSRDENSASRLDDEQMMQELTLNKIGVSLAQIGISVIGGKQPRSEIIFVSIKKLQLIMMQKQNLRNFQLKIKYINIDNNLFHNTIYPVLFTPLKERKTIEKARPFFICLVEQNLKTQQITEINYFRMAIEPISFKLYDETVSKLYDMQKELSNQEEQAKNTDLCNIYRSYKPKLEWMEKEPSAKDKSIFIRQIQIGKLVIELSFSIKPSSGGNIIIYTIVTLFRAALSNVSESQISLSRFHQRNVSLGDLTNQLSEFYRKQIFKEIYKIPTSINILGNPYVLVRYLAEGAWEVINQPSEGFIKGPIEGAIGVVKGGVYFARNIVAGTCNSFEVMSQSCSHGISYVTFDEKFITRRQKIQMQKSKHIGDGTKLALFAFYTGFEVAITGLYRHPKENLQKSGVPGLCKGILMGVAGLVTKPLSGMFEGISKFSEGIKQTALFFQDGPNTTRSRPPRVFIGSQQYYTEYNIEQSKAVNLLQFHSTKHLKKIVMIVSVDPSPSRDDTIYTILTNIYLVVLSKSKKKVLRQVKVQQINEVEISQPGQLKLAIGQGVMFILTHKYKQFYQSFRMVFENLQKMNLINSDSS